MPRVLFKKGAQRGYLLRARSKTKILAELCRVHPRTLRDWIREKYHVSLSAVQIIEDHLHIEPHQIIKVLPDYWSTVKAAKIGGIRCNAIHGNPGTPEGRRKGGIKSWLLREKALKEGKVLDFVTRKAIHIPEISNELAEAVGIILGDGTISRFQVSISTSALVDLEYADYIVSLFKDLFQINVVRQKIRKNTLRLTLSSRKLVEYFNEMGLSIGHKIKNNVKIPEWILDDEDYLKWCLRGLFDTDGCIFYHRHFTRGREYNDIGWVFRNLNANLLLEFQNFLLKKGFKSKMTESGVWIYNRRDIHRYFEEIGSSNPKHIRKYTNYFN